MSTQFLTEFTSVYGPVKSWRYGCSLGIDSLGVISTCSFNCVYCQLGEIEKITANRSLFVPTAKILKDLQSFAPWDVDIITLSGSGEPTLALNLGEIIEVIKQLTNKPILVLTNGTLLSDSAVRSELALADKVSIKLDAISSEQLRRINRPTAGINSVDILEGIKQFSTEYQGELGIQTMVLTPWNKSTEAEYIRLIKSINPAEIQLNTPTRPKPLKHELEGRGNHSPEASYSYPVQVLKCVKPEILQALASRINEMTGIPVRCAPAMNN